MKKSLTYSLFALGICVLGMALIFSVNWKLALGVFLILWARSLTHLARAERNLEKILKKLGNYPLTTGK